jgi:hypothetical protein
VPISIYYFYNFFKIFNKPFQHYTPNIMLPLLWLIDGSQRFFSHFLLDFLCCRSVVFHRIFSENPLPPSSIRQARSSYILLNREIYLMICLLLLETNKTKHHHQKHQQNDLKRQTFIIGSLKFDEISVANTHF